MLGSWDGILGLCYKNLVCFCVVCVPIVESANELPEFGRVSVEYYAIG